MFTDTSIYRSLTVQLTTYMPMYRNMDKDFKTTIGKVIVECITDSILYMSDSYIEKDKHVKFILAKSALKKVSQCEIMVKALFDSKALSVKQTASLSFNFGQIKSQLYRWLETFEEYANGVRANALTNVDDIK